MKRIVFIILLLINICILSAYDLGIIVHDGPTFYNSFKASALDTSNPSSQPLLFTISINKLNPSVNVSNIYLHFSLTWNGIDIVTPDHRSKLKVNSESILNSTNHLSFNSREVLRDVGGQYLGSSTPSLSMSDILNDPNFKSSIMSTGLFPDGTYVFGFELKNELGENLASTPMPFVMVIKNANSINLIAPGVPVGTTIPKISNNPVMFVWNSNIVNGQNFFQLEIREFNQINSINESNIENSGQAFQHINNLTTPIYNQSIPFVENNYYAWRIKSEIINEQTSMGVTSTLSSPWFIFQYAQTQNSQPNMYQDIYNALSNIPVPLLTQFLSQGYYPTGQIKQNGQVVSPAQAQQIINQILNSSNYTIEILDR